MSRISNPFTVQIVNTQPTWLQGMAIGEWKLVSSSSLSAVAGVTSVPGNTGRSSIIIAWNGACVDPNTSTVYLLGCGGHADYAGNEVYSINLEANSPAWTLRRNATASTSNADYYSDGRPSSTHTYHTQVYVPEVSRAIRFGSGSKYSNGYANPFVDRFDPVANDWDAYTGSGVSLSIPNQFHNVDQSWSAVRDPNTGNVYVYHNSDNTEYVIDRWNVGSPGSFTRVVSSAGMTSYESCAAFDSTRNIALFANGNGAVRLATSTNTATGFSISGGGPGGANGMIYVPATDRYYYRSNASGGTVRQINPATWTSSAFTTTGGTSIPSRQNGCYNSFGYCPRLGGAFYVASYTGGVWFLRIH